jgi:hypothetical protein
VFYGADLHCCNERRVDGHSEFVVHDVDGGISHGFHTAGYLGVFFLGSGHPRIGYGDPI